MLPQWISWLYAAIAGIAAVTDYREGKIYNWLTLPAIVFGLGIAFFFGLTTFVSALQGVGVAALLYIPLFALGILGGGDVKLMLAMGTVLGTRGTLELTFACFLVAGIGAFALMIAHKRVRFFFKEFGKFLRSLVVPGLEIQWPKLSRDIKAPFGIAIFIGFIYVLASGGTNI